MKTTQPTLSMRLLLFGILICAACTPPDDSPYRGLTQNRVAVGLISSYVARGTDSLNLIISSYDSSFGGVWYDQTVGGLVASTVAPLPDPLLLPAVTAALSNDPVLGKRQVLKQVQVTHTFLQLIGMKVALRSVAAQDEVSELGVDVRNNTLEVVVGNEADVAALRNRVTQQGGDNSAVVVSIGQPARQSFNYTYSRIRPVLAGIEVTIPYGGGRACTMGGSVIVSGSYGFVTAGHCNNDTIVGYTGATLYQTNWSSGGDALGIVTMNPPTFTGGACGLGLRCRYSDAEFIPYSGHCVLSGFDICYGGKRIWVTDTIGTGPSYYGLQLSYALTTSGVADLLAGTPVLKTGYRTGTTTGTISLTCVQVTVAGVTFLCQDVVLGYSDGGDSGGAVFWTDSSSTPYKTYHLGILTDRTTNDTAWYFSPWQGIEDDMPVFY